MKVSVFHTPDSYSSMLPFQMYCGSYPSMAVWVHFSYFFLDLPAGEKLHDLVALLNFDVSKVVGETLGAQSVWRHQEILQEHWSSSDVAILPGEDVQHCLLGVTIIYFDVGIIDLFLDITTWKPVSCVLFLIPQFLFPDQPYIGTGSSSGKISYQSQNGCLMTVEHCLSQYCLW